MTIQRKEAFIPSEEFITAFTEQSILWVKQQRDILRVSSQALPPSKKTLFGRFFEPDILNSARFAHVSALENPPFYKEFSDIPLLDIEQMVAFTFIDTIAATGNLATGTRFHELVHVEQFYQLGTEGAALYIRQWRDGDYDYWNIDLEEDASELVAWYHSNSKKPFSVREEVAQRLEAYKFQ